MIGGSGRLGGRKERERCFTKLYDKFCKGVRRTSRPLKGDGAETDLTLLWREGAFSQPKEGWGQIGVKDAHPLKTNQRMGRLERV